MRVTLTTLIRVFGLGQRSPLISKYIHSLCMGFLQSYLRLPRYQRVVLGLAGVALGWYGPTLMGFMFLKGEKNTESDENRSAD